MDPEPSPQQRSQLYRPLCSNCGTLSVLARVEPSTEQGHDLRIFECPSCGQVDVIKIRFEARGADGR